MRNNEACFYNIMELSEIYDLVKRSEGIATDTRTLKKGEVFFALKGPNHDGNKYAVQALKAGALAAVVDDPSVIDKGSILVGDALGTLAAIAAMHRKTIKVPVIGITGTNGKTTTKELIAAVLSGKGKVHFTKGNLNNHIGVPLTILSTPPDAAFLVIEMGANHKGEIASLCEIAMPTHGIITNIGKAHLEGFGSFEEVINAKSELYQWLRFSGGIAFYNEHNEILKELIYHIAHKAVPYSDPCGTDLMVEAIESDDLFLKLSATYEGQKYSFATSLFGIYNLDNVRAAMATGLFFGVPVEKIINAISGYKPSNNRSQISATGRNTVICDSYNANPSSMIKALDAFNKIKAGKKMIILGDMLELGRESLKEHRDIVDYLKDIDAEVFLVGPQFKAVLDQSKAVSLSDSEALLKKLRSLSPEGYTILVKGSRGMMLEKVYPAL